MLRKISVALVAAAVTTLVAGNGASAKEVREVEHGPIAKPIESPPHPIEHPSAVRNLQGTSAVAPLSLRDYPVAPPLKPPVKPPGQGGPVPTTGGGGGGFTDLPGAPVVCLGAEWRCKESVN
jgi:hypothetical protein